MIMLSPLIALFLAPKRGLKISFWYLKPISSHIHISLWMKPSSPAHRSPSLASVLRRLLRIEEEPLGVFRRILAVRSKDEKILENAQAVALFQLFLSIFLSRKA